MNLLIFDYENCDLCVGLDQEGIFRISGNLRTIEQLKTAFDNGSEVNFEEDEVDIMAVAGLLKLFLRELPDSLIPELMVKQFITVQAREYALCKFSLSYSGHKIHD
jgi:RhoGAP domain